MLKDFLDHDRIFDARNHLGGAAAVFASQDVDLELPLQPLRLRLIETRRAGAGSSVSAASGRGDLLTQSVMRRDPRHTETAKLASDHHFIRPGADAAFLLAIIHTLFEENILALGAAAGLINGFETVAEIVRDFSPASVIRSCTTFRWP